MQPACNEPIKWPHGVVTCRCFDGSAEYGESWCQFGCAAQQLDPAGKFAGASSVWTWRAGDAATATPVARFESCCTGPDGAFDQARCRCLPNPSC
jgi:hypothetical protein